MGNRGQWTVAFGHPRYSLKESKDIVDNCGAVKENIMDCEELACHLMEVLWRYYPDTIRTRYKVEAPEETPGYILLEEAGRKRGFLLSGGEINTERMAKVLLDEYRSGKLGFLTFEEPEDV